MTWTFPQTAGGGSLKFHFNWVNNQGGLIDGWLWFWVKNVGLVFLVFVPAALSSRRRERALSAGALLVFATAETILFQPNPYDNNKLFYVAFILMIPIAAGACIRCLRQARRRPVAAAPAGTLSGRLDAVGRRDARARGDFRLPALQRGRDEGRRLY